MRSASGCEDQPLSDGGGLDCVSDIPGAASQFSVFFCSSFPLPSWFMPYKKFSTTQLQLCSVCVLLDDEAKMYKFVTVSTLWSADQSVI